jgi:hypothetical protein
MPVFPQYIWFDNFGFDALEPRHPCFQAYSTAVTFSPDLTTVLSSSTARLRGDVQWHSFDGVHHCHRPVWSVVWSMDLFSGRLQLHQQLHTLGPLHSTSQSWHHLLRQINLDTQISYDPVSNTLFLSRQGVYPTDRQLITSLISVNRPSGEPISDYGFGYGLGDGSFWEYKYQSALSLDIAGDLLTTFCFYSTNNTYYATSYNPSSGANTTGVAAGDGQERT